MGKTGRLLSMLRDAACAVLFCSSALSFGAAHGDEAANYVWRNVKVGGGGFAPAIVFSRAERGLAYLRTDMGGAYRWSDGDGRWIPLQDHMPQSGYFGIESIAPDPHDANV